MEEVAEERWRQRTEDNGGERQIDGETNAGRGYVRGTAISQACCCAGWEAPSLGVSIATPGDVTS